MRDHLIIDFRPGVDAGYKYQELITLKAAGHDIPEHWITQAKHDEDADAAAAAAAAAIAADLKAAEKRREEEIAELDKRVLPQLQAMADELPGLEATAEQARVDAFAAVKAYRAAHRAASGKVRTMRSLIQEEYGDPIKDNDGNALPGQTYAHSMGYIYVNGEPFGSISIDPAFNSPALQRL